MITVAVAHQPFDPWQAVKAHQDGLALAGQYGATCVFVGTMRDFNQGAAVTGLRLDYYPGMTERQLRRMAEAAAGQWPVLATLLVHRVGALAPDEPIVLVAAWSAHRGDAFAACRHLIEELKAKAPFWKKEWLADGQGRWLGAEPCALAQQQPACQPEDDEKAHRVGD